MGTIDLLNIMIVGVVIIAEFFVHNSLNRYKAVKFNMTLRYFVLKDSEGDHKWTIEIGTRYPDKDGNKLPSKRIHKINVNNLDEAIEEAVVDLCSQIDWGPLEKDVTPPFVAYNSITDGATVPIDSYLKLIIKDDLLSAGIDISDMRVMLNNSMVDFDITSEVTVEGDPYEYVLEWRPPMIVKSRYE